MSEGEHDIVVVGAGAVGLTAALAFARAGFSTCLVGPAASARDGRTAALMTRSLDLLRSIGIEAALEPVSAPLRRMRIVDDTGSLFRPPPVEFDAAELGMPAFGRNVENAGFVALLEEAARGAPNVTGRTEICTGLEGGDHDRVRLAGGDLLTGRLVVAADGRNSLLRRSAGIPVRERGYPQAALTTIVSHARDHRETSTEFHTRAGPCTLVPLPGRRSSLVWVTTPRHAERLMALEPGELAAAIGRTSHGLLGALTVDGPRGVVPIGLLTADRPVSGRLVLVGEAAHALPPIGAQGLNLGLADVAALVAAVTRDGPSLGERALSGYAEARLADVRRRSFAVDGLNRALLTDFLPLDLARGFGLGALARIGPLRRAVMRAGLMTGATPPTVRRG